MFYICISYMFVKQARGQCAVYIYNTVVLLYVHSALSTRLQ